MKRSRRSSARPPGAARAQTGGPGSDGPFPKLCNCGASYDEAAWQSLPLRGKQPSEPGHHLELRVCGACGSTLSVERPDPD